MILNRFQQNHKILMSLRNQIWGDFWWYRFHRNKNKQCTVFYPSHSRVCSPMASISPKTSPKFTKVHRSSPMFTGVHERSPPISPKQMYGCCDFRWKVVPPKFNLVHRNPFDYVKTKCVFIENHIFVLKTFIF